MPTFDVDRRCSSYNTCQRIVGVFFFITIRVILIRTATATIDVATIWIAGTRIRFIIRCVFRCTIIICYRRTCRNTYRSTIDIEFRILKGMAIFTTAIYRAFDVWTCGCIFCSDIHLCAIHPRHTVVGINGRSAFGCSHITS